MMNLYFQDLISSSRFQSRKRNKVNDYKTTNVPGFFDVKKKFPLIEKGDQVTFMFSDEVTLIWDGTRLKKRLKYKNCHPFFGMGSINHWVYLKKKDSLKLASSSFKKEYIRYSSLSFKSYVCWFKIGKTKYKIYTPYGGQYETWDLNKVKEEIKKCKCIVHPFYPLENGTIEDEYLFSRSKILGLLLMNFES
jgi:hypothetical protein